MIITPAGSASRDPAYVPAARNPAYGDDGFTISELLIATAITLSLMAAVFGVANPAQAIFEAQPELSDMQQRLRIGVDAIAKDLLMAGVPVMPYRAGERESDPGTGIFYRHDTITVVSAPWESTEATSHTYYVKSNSATKTSQLMHYDGADTDLPVVDHVVRLQFEYFGTDPVPLDPLTLQDGPWFPDAGDANRFDADLLRIRRVRVTLRVQAANAALRGTALSMERFLPDREIRFDVSPRNLNLE